MIRIINRRAGTITVFLFILFLFIGCETITTAQYYFANNGTNYRFDYTEVPFKWDRAVIIPFAVNGSVLDFALDTGSPAIAIVGHKKTQALNLPLGADVQLGGTGTGNSPVGQVVSDIDLAIGNITLLDQTAIWIPWDQISFFRSEPEVFIDGIIGYDLFKRFVVELDFDKKRMVLIAPDHYQYNGSGESFELSMSSRKPYMIAEVTTLEGKTTDVKLHVDLGSSSNLNLIPNAKPEIAMPARTVRIPGWGMSGISSAGLGRVKQLKLGKYKLDSVLTRFPYDGYSLTADRHGVLGIGVLSRFKVIFDYERSRMILEPRPNAFASFAANKSGLGFSRYADGYIVNYILTETAAAKVGLAVGDLLQSIDGHAASELSRQELDRYLSLDTGTTLEVCVLRERNQLCLDLELVDPGI